jgi:hypothetical protein
MLLNKTILKYQRCIRTANKRCSRIKDYGKKSFGENRYNIKHFNIKTSHGQIA